MNLIDSLSERAKLRGGSVVFPEGHDERIVTAAHRLVSNGFARPILLGKTERIAEAARRAGVSLDGIEMIDPAESDRLDAYAAEYGKGRTLKEGIARRMVRKSLFFGGMMVACDDADTVVAGIANATATVIQAGVLTIGYAAGIETVSSFFLMLVPSLRGEKYSPLIFADCAINIDPTAEQLADIALASEASAARLLGETPRVAMLSFSTCGSASHAHVEKVTEAVEIARTKRPDAMIDGEFQMDAAVDPRVAEKKIKRESRVAGRANVLVFPNLDSGNIAYKATQYLGAARAIGPVLQGFAKPISDLSRGANVDDIVTTAVVTLALC